MKDSLSSLITDLRMFLRAWIHFWYKRIYRIFSVFEFIKRLGAKVLYRQRGRFARPFVHSAMMGIIALAITLAPVLASSFPGVEANEDVITPEQNLMGITDVTVATEVPQNRLRDKVENYTVVAGDTLSGIATKFGVSTDTIRWENNLSSINSIKPGQTLRILPVTGVKHTVSRGETIYTIAKKYGANPQAIVDFPFNTFADNENFTLAVGQELIVPDGEKPNEQPWSPPRQYTTQLTPNAGAVSGTGKFAWPISGTMTQRYSWYHRGLDIATAHGTPVLASDAGKVMVAGWPDNSGYGNRVVIDHGNGYQTWYAHLSKISVVVGQTVKRGDVVGLEGSTGRSTGPHLHFEIRLNGVHQNPLNLLK